MTELATLTTLRLGGRARRLIAASTERAAVLAVQSAESSAEPTLVLAGGSNVVIADDGFPGTVVHVVTRGVDASPVGLTVAAGEPWDAFVDHCVHAGLAGIECLSGIPGSTGATPIQNVGAYGQEVSQTISSVRVYDRLERETRDLASEDCDFGYRTSMLKRSRDRWLVLSVTFSLRRQATSMPIAYAELAKELSVGIGDTAPLPEVRAAVLRLRRRKGMVVDPADPDSVSAGSFFMNPILTEREFGGLEQRVAERLGDGVRPPRFVEPDGRVKTSAAWLVERTGFTRGYGDGRVGISSKHTLALVNRGGGTAAELVALAETVAAGVHEAFGVELAPEPVLVGIGWEPEKNLLIDARRNSPPARS